MVFSSSRAQVRLRSAPATEWEDSTSSGGGGGSGEMEPSRMCVSCMSWDLCASCSFRLRDGGSELGLRGLLSERLCDLSSELSCSARSFLPARCSCRLGRWVVSRARVESCREAVRERSGLGDGEVLISGSMQLGTAVDSGEKVGSDQLWGLESG